MFNRFSLSPLVNLRRHKTFTIINIIGFSLGLASAISIFLYVFDELTYDDFHEDAESIYRVTTESRFSAEAFTTVYTPLVLAEAVGENDRSLLAGRIFLREVQLTVAGDKIKATDFAFGDPSILSIFSFRFLAGNPKSALNDIQSVIVNERTAKRLFGSTEAAIGKEVLMENRLLLRVTGVFRDWPAQSHINLNMIANFENYLALENENIRSYLKSDWLFTSVMTYLKAAPGVPPERIQASVDSIRARLADARVKRGVHYHIQALKDIHLYSNFTSDSSGNQIIYVYIFTLVGLLIVFMACANFINLSLATSVRRFREISIRKVLGGDQRSIILQILAESLMYVTVSFLLAILIVYLVLPYLNAITHKELSFRLLSIPLFSTVLAVVVAGTGIVAGLIPAILIARVNPANGIKGRIDNLRFTGMSLTRYLVVIQFVGASVLLLFFINVKRQTYLLANHSLGFQKDRMVVIPLFMENINSIFGGVDSVMRNRMNAFEDALMRETSIESVTLSSALPGESTVLALVKSDVLTEEDNVFMAVLSVDYDFTETYRIPVKAGRSFSREAGTDHIDAFMINESAIGQLGYAGLQDAVGKEIEVAGKKGRIVGVVQDFNFEGLQEVIRPLILEVAVSKFTDFTIRIAEQAPVAQSLELLKATWSRIFPDRYFEYFFLENNINENYRSQFKLQQVIQLFSSVAIFISALGLFGLGAYSSNSYLREVSIRKLSGAETLSIVGLLMQRQLRLGFMALVIGFPAGYWISRLWLERFAYHVDTTWAVFAVTYVSLALVLAVATLYHILRVSRVNPLEVIRSE